MKRYCSVLIYPIKKEDSIGEEDILDIVNQLKRMNINVGFREVYGVAARSWVFDFLNKEDHFLFQLGWNHLTQKTIYFDDMDL